MSTDGLPGPSTSTSPDAPAPDAPAPDAPAPDAPAPDAPARVAPIAGPPPLPVRTPAAVPPRRRAGLLDRFRRDERGEGVISAAIAVLIMAFVGVAAFVAYRGIMDSVTEKTTECVDVYVSNGSGCD